MPRTKAGEKITAELTDEDLCAVKEAKNEPGVSWSDAKAELNAD